jgi:dTDP-4-amino-4,6-dideoxygalactose transaminase
MTTTTDESERISVPFVDLGPTSNEVRTAILSDLASLIEKGAFINGPYVEAFEQAFADTCGRGICIGLGSGTDALRLVLDAIELGPGDEVVVPAMTFFATFEAVVQAGARVVVVDVDEEDVGMDVEAASDALGGRTRALLPVHLYGQMADARGLIELADRHGLSVIEDACQAHGAERDGIRAGTAGLAAAYSFYPSKNLGAWGDAGALVLDDEGVAAKVRALREHGQTRRYHSDYVGYTARLDAVQAVVLAHKLPRLERWNGDRQVAAGYYSDELSGVGDLRLPTVVAGAKHVWHVYTVRTADPSALGEFLARRGIGTGRHYPEPPHLSPAFAELGYPPGSFPVAEAVARETLSLPIYPGISEAQLEAVVAGVREFFARG